MHGNACCWPLSLFLWCKQTFYSAFSQETGLKDVKVREEKRNCGKECKSWNMDALVIYSGTILPINMLSLLCLGTQ